MKEEPDSLRNIARLAGLFLILNALTTGFSLGYVRSSLIVSGDAVTTANNLMAHDFLFRMGIVGNVLSQFFLFFFGLTVFRLFKRFNINLATVFIASLLVAVTIGIVNSLNNLGAILVLSQAEYLNAFQPDQLKALMMIFLRLNNSGVALIELVATVYLSSFGLLIWKSGYLPRIFGILLIVGGSFFVINTFSKILIPTFYPALITQITMFANALWGIPVIFWLLIKGASEPTPMIAADKTY
jgi:hypothetical protein